MHTCTHLLELELELAVVGVVDTRTRPSSRIRRNEKVAVDADDDEEGGEAGALLLLLVMVLVGPPTASSEGVGIQASQLSR